MKTYSLGETHAAKLVGSADPVGEAENRESYRLLYKAIKSLPRHLRSAVEIEFRSRTVEASSLGLTRAGVAYRKRSALRKLRRWFLLAGLTESDFF